MDLHYKQEISVGLLVITALALFAAGLAVLSGKTLGTSRGARVAVRFADVNGLRAGDPVQTSGVKVGRVENVVLQDVGQVMVYLSVSPDWRPHQDARASVAPLDFFYVKDGVLRFHDLAVDIGLTGAREYQVSFEAPDGEKGIPREERLQKTELDLSRLAPGVSRLSLELSIPGSKARRVRVEVSRKGPGWVVARVRHA